MDDRDFENSLYACGWGDTRDLTALADALDRGLNVDRLLEYIRSGPFDGRKDFCRFLGIGESTLSGWLKEGGSIPKMVKLVVGLLMVGDLYEKWLEELEASTNPSDRLVRDGDKFMIVSFGEGHGVGQIAAREIPDEATGRRLMSHQELKRLLGLALGAIEDGSDERLVSYVTGEIESLMGTGKGPKFVRPVREAEETDGSSTDGTTADK